MYPANTGTVLVYEGGVSRGNFGAYTPGTVFRVAVESGVVKYYRNGAVIYTSTIAPTYPLLVDTALYTTGATISNIVISSGGAADVTWLLSDHLGTPRMTFDQSGSLAGMRRHDYLPFGEELFANSGARTPTLGYIADSVRQKFTSKERDNETDLDYFLARYYSAAQGRFTSPDEFSLGPAEVFVLGSGDNEKQALPYAEITNPQSLNKYAYVYNNPLRFIDPNGHQGQGWWWEALLNYLGQMWKAQNFQDGMLANSGNGERQKRDFAGPLDWDPNKLAMNATIVTGQALEVLADAESTLFDPTGVVTVASASHRGDGVSVVVGLAGMVAKGGKPLEKVAAAQLSKRFTVTMGDDIGQGMPDVLAVAKNNKRSIVMEVTGSADKSISQIRRQLQKGYDYMMTHGKGEIQLYVMVTNKKMAHKIRKQLGRVRRKNVNTIIAQ